MVTISILKHRKTRKFLKVTVNRKFFNLVPPSSLGVIEKTTLPDIQKSFLNYQGLQALA